MLEVVKKDDVVKFEALDGYAISGVYGKAGGEIDKIGVIHKALK